MADQPHYGAQTKARKAALDVLFAADQRGRDILEAFTESKSLDDRPVRELTNEIVRGVAEHRDAIDRRISEAVTGSWSLDRMPAVDRNLARIAVFEMDHTDTPGSAIISDAVRLASDLSTDESPSFLNGLLSRALATKPIDH